MENSGSFAVALTSFVFGAIWGYLLSQKNNELSNIKLYSKLDDAEDRLMEQEQLMDELRQQFRKHDQMKAELLSLYKKFD